MLTEVAMSRVTLRDVAERANVSVNTVSRALNDKSGVSGETRKRIMEIAEELGYTQNLVARGLVTQSTNVIGVVVSDNVNPYFSEVIQGISLVTQARGLTQLLVNTWFSRSAEREAVNTLVQHRVDGLILFPLDWSQVDEYLRYRLPMVCVGAIPPNAPEKPLDVVAPDDYGGTTEAIEYLIRAGRKRIAYCGPGEDSISGIHRWNGYEKAIEAAGLQPIFIRLEANTFDAYKLGLSADQFQDVDAVFAFNDMIAIGLLRAFGERGIRVPTDIALVGYDDIQLARYLTPALTTVRIPKAELGRQAATLLIQRMGGDFLHRSVERLLPTELIVRETA
jgi:LacI family transcriptional regulator